MLPARVTTGQACVNLFGNRLRHTLGPAGQQLDSFIKTPGFNDLAVEIVS